MATGNQSTRDRSRRTDERRYYTSFVLLVVIGLIIFWQAATYRGVIAILAEWQFGVFGSYHPIGTYIVIMGLLGLPLYLIGVVQKRSTRRRLAAPRHAVRRAGRLARILFATAAALAIAAFVTFAQVWTHQPSDGAPLQIDVATNTQPQPGLATLNGEVVYDRMTTLDQHSWFLGHSIRFVPVVPRGGGGRGSTVRFFVALPADSVGGNAPPQAWTGTLREGGLPGEIVRLYRYAGYRVEAPYYVLFTDPDMLTWSNRMLAMQLTMGAFIFLLGGLLQMAHVRQMRRALTSATESLALETETMAPTA